MSLPQDPPDEAASPVRPAILMALKDAALERPWRPARHEEGDSLDLAARGVHPDVPARLGLHVQRFVGGGFAGQVYQVRLETLEGAIEGLAPGGVYALKILRPPSRFSVAFRDALYALAFQAPFSAEVHSAAIRAGALWQTLLRRGAALEFGRENAVARVLATLFDPELRAFGEVSEWVPGRIWSLEIDDRLPARWRERPQRWAEFRPDVPSPEYLNKRAFMARLVRLFHRMGAHELARQYEWWSLKSQPNALRRLDAGPGPADGLTAIDFRAGLALLPLLPMSPVDVALIWRGFGRGALVQFDRGDLAALEAFVEAHRAHFEDLLPALAALVREDRAYRRAVPDLTRQGVRLFGDRALRADVREGLVSAWQTRGLVDRAHADRLRTATPVFALFVLLGGLPILGPRLRRLWGDPPWRRHVLRCLTSGAYLARTFEVHALETLLKWHEKGRVDDARATRLLLRPGRVWAERILVGWLPRRLHRALVDPAWLWERIREAVLFPVRLYFRPDFREQWLRDQVDAAKAEGMLDPAEEARILASIGDPFIQTYLKCVAVHAATLPVTQVVSVLVALWYVVFRAATWNEGLVVAGVILAVFQGTPISPGSLLRGSYVVYRMIRDRNVRDYWVAGIISFWHYVGYLGFPIQMVARFPGLARFLGGTWATRMAHVVPVFGERGALLEHFVFDAFFNLPLSIGASVRRWRTARRAVRTA
ncbi:MAG: hypothetical protein JXB39_08370 [Deltaproteobacteria bacterium]|nr:hypothetical protein [Deltaproteobacteria bacterium]